MGGLGDAILGIVFQALCSVLVAAGVQICLDVTSPPKDVEQGDETEPIETKKKEKEEDCVTNCCSFMCCVCGCSFCCSKQPVDRTLLYTTIGFWIFAFAVGGGAVVKYGLNDSVSFNMTIGDQQLIDVSPLFCQAQKVSAGTKHEPWFLVYYLDDQPTINSSVRVEQDFLSPTSTLPWHDDSVWYSFYLLQGSQVEVTPITTDGVLFLLLRGKSNLNAFKNGECDSCAIVSQPLGPVTFSYKFTVSSSDYYYFVAVNDKYVLDAKIAFSFQLKRATYDLQNALAVVVSSNDPYVEFPSWNSGHMIVIYPALNSSATEVSLSARCETRLAPYLLLFMLIPLFMLIASYLVVFGRTLPSWWPWCQSRQHQSVDVKAINTITKRIEESDLPITSQPI